MNESVASIKIGHWLISSPIDSFIFVSLFGMLFLLSLISVSYLCVHRLKLNSMSYRYLVFAGNVVAHFLVIVLMLDVQKIRRESPEFVLLTPGFMTLKSDRVFTGEENIFAFTRQMNEQELNRLPEESKHIKNLASLSKLLVKKPQMQVFGNGLSAKEWRDLTLFTATEFSVLFYPSKPILGFTDTTWRRSSVVGETVTVSGFVQSGASKGLYSVSLIEPGGNILADTVVRPNERFSIEFVPKAKGIWRYKLTLQDPENNILEEPINIDVRESAPVDVVIRQSSPSFEARHLQNVLGGLGNQVTVVTQISQEKHLVQLINHEDIGKNNGKLASEQSLRTGKLTAELLDHTDLLLMDGRAYSSMPHEQRVLFEGAIRGGLGVIMTMDEMLLNFFQSKEKNEGKTLTSLANFVVTSRHDAPNANQQSLVNWGNRTADLPISTGPYRVYSETADTLAYDNNGAPVVVNQKHGRGHIALSTIKSSYQWKTAGEERVYGQFWQMLVRDVARRSSSTHWLPQNSAYSYVQHMNHRICVNALEEGVSARYVTPQERTHKMELSVYGAEISWQCGYFVSSDTGWYKFELINNNEIEDSLYVYVNGEADWLAERQRRRHSATNEKVNELKSLTTANSYRPFNKLLIGLLLIACLTGLWIERRRWMR